MFRPNTENITFYNYSFARKTCLVEWKKNGKVFDTVFREACAKRTRRKPEDVLLTSPPANNLPKKKKQKVKSPIGNLSPAIELQTKNKPVSSVQSGPMKSMFGSFELDETILGGDDPMEVHFLTEALNMSRIDIIESLPREMQQQFFECGWVLDRKKQLHCPILVLSPFSIKDGNITSEWLRKYRASVENMDKMPYLVYWYQAGSSNAKDFKAFGLVQKEAIIWYDSGIEQKFDSPFEEKINSFQTLTRLEDDVMRGINQMKEDSKLPREKRGG